MFQQYDNFLIQIHRHIIMLNYRQYLHTIHYSFPYDLNHDKPRQYTHQIDPKWSYFDGKRRIETYNVLIIIHPQNDKYYDTDYSYIPIEHFLKISINLLVLYPLHPINQ